MTFILRQVTRRSGGGDIVRTRTLTAAEPVIGRGAAADIPVPDLAISLSHARLRQTGPGAVEIEAFGAGRFEAGGKAVSRAELKLADAPALGFGRYRLTLTAGEAGEVVITLAHDEAAPEVIASHDGAFSLSGAVFSKRRLAWTLALLVLAVGLAWPIGSFFLGARSLPADGQWSSGPLSQAHAFLEDDCQACHQKAFVAVRDDACMACHQAGREPATLRKVAAEARAAGSPFTPRFVDDHADRQRLMRGAPLPSDLGGKVETVFRRAFNRPDDRCGSCHLEHIGPEGARPAKVPALVTVNDCADCHAGMKGRLKDTALADVPDWGRHPEFRPLVTVSPEGPRLQRVSLSQRPREATGLIFPHRLHVSPTGGPARMAQTLGQSRGYGAPLACANCHRPGKDGRGFTPVVMERDCAACHSLAFARVGGVTKSLPHGEPAQVAAALAGARGRVRAAFSAGGACFDCHKVIAPADGSLAYRIAPVHLTARFMPRGAFDHGVPEHRKDAKGALNCAACHATQTSDSAADLLTPTIAECVACHGKAKGQVHAPASADCAECHSYHAPGTPARKSAVR